MRKLIVFLLGMIALVVIVGQIRFENQKRQTEDRQLAVIEQDARAIEQQAVAIGKLADSNTNAVNAIVEDKRAQDKQLEMYSTMLAVTAGAVVFLAFLVLLLLGGRRVAE